MIGVRLDQCEIQGAAVKIRVMGKGSKERFIRITAELFEQIRAAYPGSTYLFETTSGRKLAREYVSNAVKLIGARIGRNISAHCLRHSWATRKVQQLPGKLDAVSKYMGHSSTSITLNMYCHTQLSDAELFDAELVG